MEALLFGIFTLGLVLVGIALIKIPGDVWDLTAGATYRNSSRAYPSARRLRLMQTHGVALVTVGVAIIAGFITAGRGGEWLKVAAWVLLAGIPFMVAMLVRVFTLSDPDERDLPANEPADWTYGLWGAVTALGIGGFGVSALILMSIEI